MEVGAFHLGSNSRTVESMTAPRNTPDKAIIAQVRDRIFEAAQALRVLPDRERAFLRAGERSCWPTVILSYWEAYGQQGVRFRLPAPSAAKITRMEEALGWIAWLGQHDHTIMKCVWLCCGEDRSPSGCANTLGLHRNTIRLHRDDGLSMIARKFGLRAAA